MHKYVLWISSNCSTVNRVWFKQLFFFPPAFILCTLVHSFSLWCIFKIFESILLEKTEWMEFWCFKLWLKSSARNKHVSRWNVRWIPSVNCKSVIQTWTPVNSTCFTLLQLSAKLSSRKPLLTQTQREKVLSLSCSGPCLITLRPTVIKHKRHRVYIQGKLGIGSTLYNKRVALMRDSRRYHIALSTKYVGKNLKNVFTTFVYLF